MKPGIIIFGEHLLNTLGQIRSFGEAGYSPDVVWLAAGAHSPKGSRYIGRYIEVKNVEEGLSVILNRFSGGEKKILSTDSDRIIAALDVNYDRFIAHFDFFNAHGSGRLTPYMKKETQCKLAESFGLSVPKTVHIGEDLSGVAFPVFLKSADSLSADWKKDSAICRNESELRTLQASSGEKDLLIQEYIDKDNEIAYEGISFNGGETVYIPIEGEYDRLPDDGYGTLKHNGPCRMDDMLRDAIEGMIRKIGFSGIFEVEFLRGKDGRLVFLEINFRHTQYNHAITELGANFSEIWASGGKTGLPYVTGTKTVFNEVKDFKDNVRTGKITLFQWLGDFFRSDSHYLFDRKDPVFALRFIIRSVLLSLKLIRR